MNLNRDVSQANNSLREELSKNYFFEMQIVSKILAASLYSTGNPVLNLPGCPRA
ncbi:MAG: hypothetical protein OEL87_00240 [Nanoarchaeota archaeon]|nr:hypothetical protein [Nanoarchaeota archaeon]